MAATPVFALEPMGDDALSDVAGEGLTFAWTNFRAMFDPQAYIEQTGSPLGNTCTSSGSTSGNYNCWRRGDIRWFGANVSGVDGNAASNQADYTPGTANLWATTWTTTGASPVLMTQCADSGIYGLGCPRGGPVGVFAAPDNPYILRVASYAGDSTATGTGGNAATAGIVTYEGNAGTGTWSWTGVNSNLAGAGSAQTVLEWLAPSNTSGVWGTTGATFTQGRGQDRYRLSFWGEIEVGRGGVYYSGNCASGAYVYPTQVNPCGNNANELKSQTIIQGNAAGSILRFFKFTQRTMSPGLVNYNVLNGVTGCSQTGSCSTTDGTSAPVFENRTLAIQYLSHLQGDFRFSVAQTEATPSLGVPVVFNAYEGLYFRNADVFFPLGQPFYQALIIGVPRNPTTNAATTDGNFTLEIPVLPNRTAVFTRFYSLNTAGSSASVVQTWDYGYATARDNLLRLAAATNASRTYMPNADVTNASFPTDYPALNPNYQNTHGYAHWGDWYPCQGSYCIYPSSSNTAAQADAGTGRNSWRSSGDGTFFWNTTRYYAISYRTWAVDVRAPSAAGENDYTIIAGMGNTANTVIKAGANGGSAPTSNTNNVGACAGAATSCGYGGPHLDGSSFGNPVSNQTVVLPYNGWYNDAATGLGTTGSIPVVVVNPGTPLNIGDSRIDGIQLNFLRFTSFGANY